MRRAERESFLKSFGVFFLSLAFLSGVLEYYEYFKLKHEIHEKVYNEMRLCSYDLKCTQYDFDFVPLESKKLYQLSESHQELYALFSIPKNDTYALKLSLSQSHYQKLLRQSQNQVIGHYLWALAVILVISALFSLYALNPLRRALRLTEEFSRDILHDLNTPLSTLRLNVSRLSVEQKDEKKIARITQSIDTIVSLGDNLRGYLEEHDVKRERFDLHGLLEERLIAFQKLYPEITFTLNQETLLIDTNRDAFVRIIDNLLSNAAKYNIRSGSVNINVDSRKASLFIQDTGKGIAHPEKIFERFYKEHERGMGIGLHIVKKFCDMLKISIEVESSPGKGSLFTLQLASLTVR
ncbi:MAG: HAMP domain-containing sensor histidine kinase [Sulfuricurvum sp.]|uniref:sensor histidine kinase n=1 Tax=Sulfuricurvum sp. TaxID=2025608 RepID=UPI00261BF3A3|nr:HAMP domain-containing sensor histidine kinase [Sulfuricurvum sp.]MDD2950024.1 HAMP domain-containing sensor histidine kinase [Sulfuricurvum sp.]MDD5117951.1 HAMP domain-containing sensor histidine kinase [Sulfuricurvum sp.]MDD5160197.1 HAMP domain-containing sensor histidine kinase [Sulfuricurvum sp.]